MILLPHFSISNGLFRRFFSSKTKKDSWNIPAPPICSIPSDEEDQKTSDDLDNLIGQTQSIEMLLNLYSDAVEFSNSTNIVNFLLRFASLLPGYAQKRDKLSRRRNQDSLRRYGMEDKRVKLLIDQVMTNLWAFSIEEKVMIVFGLSKMIYVSEKEELMMAIEEKIKEEGMEKLTLRHLVILICTYARVPHDESESFIDSLVHFTSLKIKELVQNPETTLSPSDLTSNEQSLIFSQPNASEFLLTPFILSLLFVSLPKLNCTEDLLTPLLEEMASFSLQNSSSFALRELTLIAKGLRSIQLNEWKLFSECIFKRVILQSSIHPKGPNDGVSSNTQLTLCNALGIIAETPKREISHLELSPAGKNNAEFLLRRIVEGNRNFSPKFILLLIQAAVIHFELKINKGLGDFFAEEIKSKIARFKTRDLVALAELVLRMREAQRDNGSIGDWEDILGLVGKQLGKMKEKLSYHQIETIKGMIGEVELGKSNPSFKWLSSF